jgi:NADH-quinone oxidoreductase subunit N
MAAVAKVGGFAALLRVFITAFGLERTDWQPVVWILVILTVMLGSLVALAQQDIKRMLAYSSINHAGFVLLGLQAATRRGIEGSLYYLFAYTFMVLGSFAVITVVGGRGDGGHRLERYRGLAKERPWLAGSLTVLLVAQAGIPFTTGFWAKLEVLVPAVSAHSAAIAVVAMVSAVIAAFFYLRVVLYMYSPAQAGAAAPSGAGESKLVLSGAPLSGASVSGPEPAVGAPEGEEEAAEAIPSGVERVAAEPGGSLVAGEVSAPSSPTLNLAIAICVGVTLVLGVWPAPLLDFARTASHILV